MSNDWFQELKSDLFQTDYAPGRPILEDLRKSAEKNLAEIFGIPENLLSTKQKYTKDENNKSSWITVVYRNVHDASKAANELPLNGLNVYYPMTRFRCTQIEQYIYNMKGVSDTPTGRMVPAFGRYLLIQLPEDQETFENLEISQSWLEGPFNKNGVVTILSQQGEYSLTPNEDVVRNKNFQEKRNKRTDPTKVLRFAHDETVRVIDGNLLGWHVRIVDDVPLSYKVASKVKVYVGSAGSIHQVRIAWLEKI